MTYFRITFGHGKSTALHWVFSAESSRVCNWVTSTPEEHWGNDPLRSDNGWQPTHNNWLYIHDFTFPTCVFILKIRLISVSNSKLKGLYLPFWNIPTMPISFLFVNIFSKYQQGVWGAPLFLWCPRLFPLKPSQNGRFMALVYHIKLGSCDVIGFKIRFMIGWTTWNCCILVYIIHIGFIQNWVYDWVYQIKRVFVISLGSWLCLWWCLICWPHSIRFCEIIGLIIGFATIIVGALILVICLVLFGPLRAFLLSLEGSSRSS